MGTKKPLAGAFKENLQPTVVFIVSNTKPEWKPTQRQEVIQPPQITLYCDGIKASARPSQCPLFTIITHTLGFKPQPLSYRYPAIVTRALGLFHLRPRGEFKLEIMTYKELIAWITCMATNLICWTHCLIVTKVAQSGDKKTATLPKYKLRQGGGLF
jgi:hypothetical protein